MQSSIRIGCAGWSLPSNVASLFPTEGSHLQRYAQVFPCVEINSSFYRSHKPKTYLRWAGSVPKTFRFSVKMPRTVTHDLRLRRCEKPVRGFLDEIASLGSTLGCILVQLPPSLALDERDATAFFSLLRRCTQVPIACEPRHATWFTPLGSSILKEAGIACVEADPPPVAGADCPGDPALFYLRLHGTPHVYYSAYDDAFLEGVAAQIRRAHAEKRDVWCIFDNTARGAAVPNAMTLLERLA
ncbi:uncharacterized protein YecE (DUF72 family) [Luteibacter sp. W1I16]|uniref:DUF72 domain-containing protein n=1 Tax=Luteibacter sp. W1I16 TaxID=3373922 RepID=UPI003D23B168